MIFVMNMEQIPCMKCSWDHWTSETLEHSRYFWSFGFLKKLCRLYFDEHTMIVTDAVPTKTIKTLHKTIKKVADDIENFSFNTSVSQFMICVNCRPKVVILVLLNHW
jgi:leucyl-tRNA synthetase